MSAESKTIGQIQTEIEILKGDLKVRIDQFIKSSPDVDLKIDVEKREYTLTDGGKFIYFDHIIKVII